MTDVAGQLAPSSRRVYLGDAAHFATWLKTQGLSLADVTESVFIGYRRHLADNIQAHGRRYSKVTASRMLVIARRICREAARRGILTIDPAADVRGFKGTSRQETPHRALHTKEARRLVDAVDTTTKKGKRDYALLLLLARTGIRKAEAAALQIGDLMTEQGHNGAIIRHGKDDVRRTVKLPVDVRRALTEYLVAAERTSDNPAAPLFVRIRRGDRVTAAAMSGEAIEDVVTGYAQKAGLDGLTPHGLKASCATLVREGGAALHDVLYCRACRLTHTGTLPKTQAQS